MEKQSDQRRPSQPQSTPPTKNADETSCAAICQICGSRLIEIRAKLVCERCHTIWETCCEGGRG
ncbi:MAG TPA: hypothetical protein VGI40_13235 [Pirellulaceae bacterium]